MTKIISTSIGVTQGLRNTFRKNFSINPKLVTNSDVKQRFLFSIETYTNSANLKGISRAVEKGQIVPVSCTRDYINQLNKSLSGDACMNPNEYDNVLGFYTGRQNRLYILLDNIQRLIGTDHKSVFIVTLHELQHMFCYNFTNQFINTWSNELYTFYSYFIALLYKAYTNGFKSMWNTISGKDKQVIQKLINPDNGVKYLVQYLIYNYEYLYCFCGSNISTSDCKAIGEKFCMILTQNDCDEGIANTLASKITKMTYDIFQGHIGTTYKNSDNSIIIDCLRQSYLKVFNKDPWKDGTLIYQELIFPSEVVCVSSQYFYKDNKYFKFLNSL